MAAQRVNIWQKSLNVKRSQQLYWYSQQLLQTLLHGWMIMVIGVHELLDVRQSFHQVFIAIPVLYVVGVILEPKIFLIDFVSKSLQNIENRG